MEGLIDEYNAASKKYLEHKLALMKDNAQLAFDAQNYMVEKVLMSSQVVDAVKIDQDKRNDQFR